MVEQASPDPSTGRRGRRPRLLPNVAPGVHLLEHAGVNCYLIEERGTLTVVDTAHPKTWPLIGQAIRAIGRSPSDVRAVVLTHAHFDHLGFARRAREEWGVPVLGHAADAYIARHPYRYAHENARLVYPVRHPKAIPGLIAMVRAGALGVRGIDDLGPLRPGEVLDVPGHPRVVFTPGHTFGHCALHLADADAVLSGDALVTTDPYTGGTGPQIVSGAATADSAQAIASLDAIAETDAAVVLPGHGEPWMDGARSAAAEARAAGAS